MSTTLTAEPFGAPRSARLARYGLWQLRDYFMNRGSLTFLLCVALGYAQVFPMMSMIEFRVNSMNARALAQYGGSVNAAKDALHREAVQAFLGTFTGVVVFLGVLIAISGFAAGDRKSGFYRFLFAKPLAPVRFYGQQFLVHLLGFLAVFAALGFLFGALVAPALTVKLFAAAALMFFFYASIGLLLSAATPTDWLSLIALNVFSQFIWGRYAGETNIVAKLRFLLPPLTRTGEVYDAAVKGTAIPWHLVEWFGGYGAVCLALGLFILHRRRLAVS